MSTKERLKRIQQFISRMPSLSTTVAKVLEICNQPNPAPNDLNRVISLDPVLTGQVLKLINSAYYSLPNRITSLTRAIIMLGINTVKNLVLATSVLASFKGKSTLRQISMDDFWAHCLCVGVTAKQIAKLKKIPAIDREEFFVAGLLHDLGKLPIMACFAELYEQALEQAKTENRSLFETEMAQVGFDHGHVGQFIAIKWKLTKDMTDTMTCHHRSFNDGEDPSCLQKYVTLANQTANHLQIGSAGEVFIDLMQYQSLATSIGVDGNVLLAMRSEIEQEIEKAQVFLQASKG